MVVPQVSTMIDGKATSGIRARQQVDGSGKGVKRLPFEVPRFLYLLVPIMALAACAAPLRPADEPKAHLPLERAWVEGIPVFYVTTDVSDQAVAAEKGANHVPRLAQTLASAGPPIPGRPSAVEKVYAFVNARQDTVFSSAPAPIGPGNLDRTYSPLWRMVKVRWAVGQEVRVLTSEEAVLDAQEKGMVSLEQTTIVLNCPIVHLGARGGLPGAVVDPMAR